MTLKYKYIRRSIFLLLIIPLVIYPQGNILILAPSEFIDELQPLKQFKDCSMRPTTLLNLNQVYQSFSGVDEPEKIKKCIEYYHRTQAVQQVLLVGDVDKFPVRWRWWGRWMPTDPYFRGTWSVIGGKYVQSNYTDQKPFCSWVNIGSYNEYNIDVDCTPLNTANASIQETRIHVSSADFVDKKIFIQLKPSNIVLILANSSPSAAYTFTNNTSYHIKVELRTNSIKVYVNNVKQLEETLGTDSYPGRGKLGIGTYTSSSSFDNFKVTSPTGTVLWNEDFNDGVANNFTDAANMEERGWAITDLYYADLYKEGTTTFDDWNGNKNSSGHHEQLYGEIEWGLAGYCTNCTINNDKVDFQPDVGIGRIPASTEQEVTTYVNKVIRYEMMTLPTANWLKKAFTYQGSIGAQSTINNIGTDLTNEGFTATDYLWETYLKSMTKEDRQKLILGNMNTGSGFVNYIGGHGSPKCWSCLQFCSDDFLTHQVAGDQLLFTNNNMLPVIFAQTCFTGFMAYIPPADPYIDINGASHAGTSKYERFPGPPDRSDYVPPMSIQVGNDPGCLAEDFLFGFGDPAGSAGAIAYFGERTAGRHGALLAEKFYEGYVPDNPNPANNRVVLGDVWKYMIRAYYQTKNLKQYETMSVPTTQSGGWDHGHIFEEPQKFILFGDPSVIIGGTFTEYLSGNVYDAIKSLKAYHRYRITNNVTIPSGQKLSADSSIAILFNNGKKITALDANANNGLQLNGSNGMTICLMAIDPTSKDKPLVGWIKLYSKLKMYNNGEIKLY